MAPETSAPQRRVHRHEGCHVELLRMSCPTSSSKSFSRERYLNAQDKPRAPITQTGDETHLKCSRSGARASWEKCSRNLAPASGAAVCLGNGSTVVDGGAQRDHEEVRQRVR